MNLDEIIIDAAGNNKRLKDNTAKFYAGLDRLITKFRPKKEKQYSLVYEEVKLYKSLNNILSREAFDAAKALIDRNQFAYKDDIASFSIYKLSAGLYRVSGETS